MWKEGVYSYEKEYPMVTDDTGRGADETIEVMSNWWWEYDATRNMRELAWQRDKNVESMGSLNWFKILKVQRYDDQTTPQG